MVGYPPIACRPIQDESSANLAVLYFVLCCSDAGLLCLVRIAYQRRGCIEPERQPRATTKKHTWVIVRVQRSERIAFVLVPSVYVGDIKRSDDRNMSICACAWHIDGEPFSIRIQLVMRAHINRCPFHVQRDMRSCTLSYIMRICKRCQLVAALGTNINKLSHSYAV